MPATRYLNRKLGIKAKDGIATNMEDFWPSATGHRHSRTRTYRNKGKDPSLLDEDFRTSLGRDLRDFRQIYREDGLYGQKVRDAMKEHIRRWRAIDEEKNLGLFIRSKQGG